jgi:hypothetical protein
MISVRSTGSAIEVVRDGEICLRAGSIQELVRAAGRLAASSPLCLPAGAQIEVELAHGDRAAFLEALAPTEDEDAQDVLYERWAEASAYDVDDIDPLDDGITVNGQPWGWFRMSSDDAFELLPIGPQSEVLRLGAWMTASMTGAVITATLVRCDDLAAAAWYEDDIDGVQWFASFYDVTREGLATACSTLLDAFSSYWSPICPVRDCPNVPEWSSPGWVVSLDASEPLDEQILADAVATLCQPCDEHMDLYGPDGDDVVSLGGRDWTWKDEGWIRSE